MKVIIIGNGIAGVSAADALRGIEGDPEKLDIEIHAAEPHGFYSRIRLPEVISDGLTIENILLHDDAWYEKRAIKVIASHGVTAIRPGDAEVGFANGDRARYDALIICTGAEPMVFPAPGLDKDGILSMRRYEDALRLHRAVKAGKKRAAVIGGGLLGIEAAHHLRMAGAESVTVVEIADRLLPRQLDERGAAMLQGLLEGRGLAFKLGAKVERYEGAASVEGIALDSGERIDADIVLLSSGIKPNASLAASAGIPCGRGIIADEFMETGIAGIFAAGDAVEFKGRIWGIIPAAIDQAQAAARAILGDKSRPYAGTVPRTSLKIAGIDLISVGMAVPEGKASSEIVGIVNENPTEGRYEKFILDDGVLIGAILLGSKKNQGWVNGRLGKSVDRSDIPSL